MSASPKKTTKSKKSAKPAAHPQYSVMIKDAIQALKERNGSSRQAIIKYIDGNYKVGTNVNTQVRLALKRMIAANSLVQTIGTGASGRFKVSKDKVDKVTKPKPKKLKVDKKKPAAKKPKKPAAKQTKKPAAKKAKKPAAKKAKKPAAKKPAAKKPAAKKQSAKKAAKTAASKKAEKSKKSAKK